MSTVEIPISRGLVTLVDEADAPLVDRRWYAKPHGRTVYAFARTDKRTVYLHRVLLGLTDRHIEVDHINHDGLDNRRCNLRVVTHQENTRNMQPRVGSTSAFKGVCWQRAGKKWHAQIGHNGRKMHLGFFEAEIDAARAYDAAAFKLYGEVAYLNFPLKVVA